MAISTPDTTLSANDTRILNALFDPETLPSSIAKSKDQSQIDSSLPPLPTLSTTTLTTLESQQNDLIRDLTSTSSPTAINSALSQITTIISTHPTYPSAHLNHAMILRLTLESQHSTLFSATVPREEISQIFNSLSRAINLCLPTSPSTSPVSAYQARILRTAFSHRAYLYLKAAESGHDWAGKDKGELEELASGDFAMAARFGDEVAREMSVRTNPYKKMCGAIVRNALEEERRESGIGPGREP